MEKKESKIDLVLVILIIICIWKVLYFEGKTAQEWRDTYYAENTNKVNLWNCVNHALDMDSVKYCIRQLP